MICLDQRSRALLLPLCEALFEEFFSLFLTQLMSHFLYELEKKKGYFRRSLTVVKVNTRSSFLMVVGDLTLLPAPDF